MITIYGMDKAVEWDALVCTFDDYDVYYLSGYAKAFQAHGDGEPCLLYYEGPEIRAIYVYMKRLTALEGVFDSITPYGYGGFLIQKKNIGSDLGIEEMNSGEIPAPELRMMWREYEEKMREQKIIDNFVRYHPLLGNAIPMRVCSEVIDLGKTVAMDLSSPEVIWKNMDSKNRNMIRKAEKSGVVIKHGKLGEVFDADSSDTSITVLDKFLRIYNATMKNVNAEKYYFFGKDFYKSIECDLKDNYEMFWAEIPDDYEGSVRVIAMSLMIFANGRLSYHLSGSDVMYRNLAPSNLLLYKAAIWGHEQGMKTFHLGGGFGSVEDNLYKFKVAFNKMSDCQFSIAKHIFNREYYDELVKERSSRDPGFNRESSFFPLYRSL